MYFAAPQKKDTALPLSSDACRGLTQGEKANARQRESGVMATAASTSFRPRGNFCDLASIMPQLGLTRWSFSDGSPGRLQFGFICFRLYRSLNEFDHAALGADKFPLAQDN